MPALAPAKPARSNLLTLASAGTIACLAADMVHEALGHGTASLITHDRILSLSTVAIQSAYPNRFVSAAGTTANLIAGVICLLVLRRIRKLNSWTYFLWTFCAFNLFNTGYLLVSAILNNGDWARVIEGLSPAWLWRWILGAAGAGFYVLAVDWVARFVVKLVNRGEVAPADLWPFILPAYFASGAIMTIASAFNPISPSLILMSGAGASFGLNAGLLFVPAIVIGKTHGKATASRPIPFSLFWLLFGLAVSGIFIAVLGPGIHFPG